jgi:small subunit ribosomal protein S17
MTQIEKKITRKFLGTVVSDKMDKTIVVQIDRVKVHALYGKRFKVGKKFKVHDPENKFKTGDIVSFVETRPLSKEKRWIVI